MKGETEDVPDSVVAIVASMDNKLAQYSSVINTCNGKEEPVSGLTEAFGELLDRYRKCNKNVMPARIIVYRDGLSEGQYAPALQKELGALKEALELRGHYDDIKIAFIGKFMNVITTFTCRVKFI